MLDQVNEIVCNVEARWTRISHVIKVLLALREGTRVDRAPFSKKDDLVEESYDV